MIKFNNAVDPEIILDNILDNKDEVKPEENLLEELNDKDEIADKNTNNSDLIKSILAEEKTNISETPETIVGDSDIDLPSYDFKDYIPEIANHLYTKGHIKHLPEDVNMEAFDLEAYEKTLVYNTEKLSEEKFTEGADAMRTSIMNKLSPFAQKIISYNLDNPNAEDSEIKQLTNELATTNYLTNLTVEDNSEEIVREYYKSDKWQDRDIDTKIDNLLSTDSLTAEAQIVKPRLDEKARAIVAQKEEENRQIQEFESNKRNSLKDEVIKQLQTGKLNGASIDRETAEFLYAAVLNEEQTVYLGNRKVQMGYAEALMRDQKYKGNIENVMLSLIVLRDGAEGIKKYYAQQAKNEEVKKHINEIKFSNNKKKSGSNEKSNGKQTLSTGLSFRIN